MIVPIVNLNGTDRHQLCVQYGEMCCAISDAIGKLQEHFPHGRDYQLQPAGTYEKARAEHEARIAKLVKVRNELSQILDAIEGQ